MAGPSPEAIANHNRNLQWWSLERLHQRNTAILALWAAGILFAIAAAQALTINVLAHRPAERTQFVALYDNGSRAQIIESFASVPVTLRDVEIKAHLWNYVCAWECFIWIEPKQRERYQFVSRNSSPAVRDRYQAWYTSKDGPPAAGDTSAIEIRKHGDITPMSPNIVKLAFSRIYYKADNDRGLGTPLREQPCELTLEFVINDAMPAKQREEDHNALGIVTVRYQLEEYPARDIKQD